VIIRRATPDDLPVILEFRNERAAWLGQLGSDQWQVGITNDEFERRVHQSIEDGHTWMAVDTAGKAVGTIAIDQWSNPGLWSDEELADAMIIHRMITPTSVAGQGIGRALLRQAVRIALQNGKRWLRLDAWTTNEGLHQYYEQAGFRHVRTADYPTTSTALFEREAALPLPSSFRRRYDDGSGSLGQDSQGNTIASGWTSVNGLKLRDPRAGLTDFTITSGTEWRLWSEDGSWWAAPPGHGGKVCSYPRDLMATTARVVEWPDQLSLNTEVEYVIRQPETSDIVELVVAPPATPERTRT
jgi:GNAT superfamily N-acetyltransferase